MALGTWKNPYGAEGGGQPSTGDLRMFGGPPASTSSGGNYFSNTGNEGGGFSGAFSKNFGKNFLDVWTSGGMGGGSSSGDGDITFGPTTMGGGSISPIGSTKHFLYQYTHPQATIMPSAPSQPGFLENVATAAIPAAIGAWCDERLKVDMAPLESTEVNDSLAEIAFFVKGLRECA